MKKKERFSSKKFADKVAERVYASVCRLNRKDSAALNKYLRSRDMTNCWFAVYDMRAPLIEFIRLRAKIH